MKKYSLSNIMKRAWELVKKMGQTISEGLKTAWAEAKAATKKVKFQNHMEVTTSDGYVRELSRWTKGGYDRVYINDGCRRGDGFVDLNTGRAFLQGTVKYRKEIAGMILAMDFE